MGLLVNIDEGQPWYNSLTKEFESSVHLSARRIAEKDRAHYGLEHTPVRDEKRCRSRARSHRCDLKHGHKGVHLNLVRDYTIDDYLEYRYIPEVYWPRALAPKLTLWQKFCYPFSYVKYSFNDWFEDTPLGEWFADRRLDRKRKAKR